MRASRCVPRRSPQHPCSTRWNHAVRYSVSPARPQWPQHLPSQSHTSSSSNTAPLSPGPNSRPILMTSNHCPHDACILPLGKPYTRLVGMGQNISYEPFSKGMTHGTVLEFCSQDDLDYYFLRDEVHAEFSRKAKNLIDDALVVNVRNGVLFAPKMKKPAGLGGLWRGSCHCEGYTWEVKLEDGEELKHVLCHCDTCKKLVGGPYSCNYIVPDGALKATTGVPGVYTYRGASGKSVRCYFCLTRTSHIYHHQDAIPDKLIVRTLLLDGGNDLTAGGEIFPEGKLGWAEDLRQSLKAATEPAPSRATPLTNGIH